MNLSRLLPALTLTGIAFLWGCGKEPPPSRESLTAEEQKYLHDLPADRLGIQAELNPSHYTFRHGLNELLIASRGVPRSDIELDSAGPSTSFTLARYYDFKQIRIEVKTDSPPVVTSGSDRRFPYRSMLTFTVIRRESTLLNAAGVTIQSATTENWNKLDALSRKQEIEPLIRLLPEREYDFAHLFRQPAASRTVQEELRIPLAWDAKQKKWIADGFQLNRRLETIAGLDFRRYGEEELRERMAGNFVPRDNQFVPVEKAELLQKQENILPQTGQWIPQAAVSQADTLEKELEAIGEIGSLSELGEIVRQLNDNAAATNRSRIAAAVAQKLHSFLKREIPNMNRRQLTEIRQQLSGAQWQIVCKPEDRTLLNRAILEIDRDSARTEFLLTRLLTNAERVALALTPEEEQLEQLRNSISKELPAELRQLTLELLCCAEAAAGYDFAGTLKAMKLSGPFAVEALELCPQCNLRLQAGCNNCKDNRLCPICRDGVDPQCTSCRGSGLCRRCIPSVRVECASCRSSGFLPSPGKNRRALAARYRTLKSGVEQELNSLYARLK